MYKVLKYGIIRDVIEKMTVVLSVINKVIPKSKKKILIFDSKEVYLNNYAIYQYLIEKKYNNEYKIYYSMPGINKTLNNKQKNVYFITGLFQTVFIYLTSSTCFIDISNLRITPSKDQKVLNLWHGTPLKKIGLISNAGGDKLNKNSLNAFSQIIVSSRNYNEVFMKSFNIKEEKILNLGQPRLDELYNKDYVLNKLGILKGYKKVIMWMTTYRISFDKRLNHTSKDNWSETNLPIIVNMGNLKILNQFLLKKNVFLIIKIHQGSQFDEKSLKSLTNILIIRDKDFIPKGIQLYEILKDCDGLITDYSSVYFDYLLLNRPIGFIIDDIQDYEKKNGFVFDDPLEYMPGEHIIDYNGLETFINNIVNNNDNYNTHRIEVNNYTNYYQDNRNCERVVEYLNL